MNEEDRVKESLEFCKDIYTYYEKKEEDENLYSQYNKAKKINCIKYVITISRKNNGYLKVIQ